jgi:hypothetical protein
MSLFQLIAGDTFTFGDLATASSLIYITVYFQLRAIITKLLRKRLLTFLLSIQRNKTSDRTLVYTLPKEIVNIIGKHILIQPNYDIPTVLTLIEIPGVTMKDIAKMILTEPSE